MSHHMRVNMAENLLRTKTESRVIPTRPAPTARNGGMINMWHVFQSVIILLMLAVFIPVAIALVVDTFTQTGE